MNIKTLRLIPLIIFFILSISACGQQAAETETPSPEPTLEPTTVPVPEGQFPFAEILNDEGGPVSIIGEVEYTNPFFTAGVAEPIVILEDQA